MTKNISPPLNDDEKRRCLAHHEAGHAVMTLASRYFQLADPAIILESTYGRTAQSGTRPRVAGLVVTKEMALEHATIALAGRAGELRLEEISEIEGRRITPHAGSTADDFQNVSGALKYWEAQDKLEELQVAAKMCIQLNEQAWGEIALLVTQKIGHVKSLSKAEVESLPSVKALLMKKPSI